MEEGSAPRLVQAVRASRGEVTCAAVCGARLLVGAGDRALRLYVWQPAAGWTEEHVAKNAHRYGVTCCVWSPGGVLAASSGVDGALRVWCARVLSARRLLAAPAAPAVRALAWPTADLLLAGHDDGALCVWRVSVGALVARLHAHEGALYAVAAPAHAALLLTACTHGTLKVFDFNEVIKCGVEDSAAPKPVLWVDGAHDMGALCAAASERGDVAATGGHDARVLLWNILGTGSSRRVEAGGVLEGHSAAVTGAAWSGHVLATAALDRTARLWARGSCLAVLHAHARYLTCVALSHTLHFMITGSNDKSVRMWALGALTIDDELQPACTPSQHFALGDLEGLGPVENEELLSAELEGGEGKIGGEGARCVWLAHDQHAGAVNCIATHRNLLATASSDGMVRIFRWDDETLVLHLEHELDGHEYPVLACDFGADGSILVSGGMDGQAIVWDVQSGCRVRSMSGAVSGAGEEGGGGVRAARVSPHHPPLLLLATDDALAPLWSLADTDPTPIFVYSGHTEAVVCCAWSGDGRVLATGAASGELRVHAAPPAPRTLAHVPDAHDLGVLSCDFASSGDVLDLKPECYLLATAGCDTLVKLWSIELNDDLESKEACVVSLVKQLPAASGAVPSVRWCGARLAAGGADEWARVWDVRAARAAAVPAPAPAGAVAVATTLLEGAGGWVVALGSLSGSLALWRLARDVTPQAAADSPDDGLDARFWSEAGVVRWIQDYVTKAPGLTVPLHNELEIIEKVHTAEIRGHKLLDDPIDNLLELFGYGESEEIEEAVADRKEVDRSAMRERLVEEITWLRRDLPSLEVEAGLPHALLCPLSHRALRRPVRAADGFSYDELSLHEWWLAAEELVSGVSGQRLRNRRAPPNYKLRDTLRAHLLQHDDI